MGKKAALRRYLPIYIMALPGLVYLFINNYIPMAGIVIAFKNINLQKGILNSDWCGFSNFKYLFSTKDAFIITRNTLLYNIAFILLGTIFSVLLALFLSEIKNKVLAKFYQTSVLLPYMVSIIIVSYLVYAFLSEGTGFLNKTVCPLLKADPIPWYSQPQYWPSILVCTNLWKSAGYGCVIYLAAILGIDTTYYEAAAMDGATVWQRIRLITIPLIMPTILMMLILSAGRIFYSDFGLFYQVPLDSGVLYPVTNVIDTYVYRALIKLGDIGMSSAASVYQSLVGFVVIMLVNGVVRKIDSDSRLF